MKSIFKTATMVIAFVMVIDANAQADKVAVIHFDARNVLISPADMGRIASVELQKFGVYEVMDNYDMRYFLTFENLDIMGCYGKLCAIEIGEILKVDKILTGTVERFDQKITYSMRLINIKSKTIEKTVVFEFANLQPYIQQMTNIMIAMLLDLPRDEQKIRELQYLNEPIISGKSRLSAKGPRMGVAYITEGAIYDFLEKHDVYPFMTQFGYQHEVQYLSSGNFQALFEFIGLINGMDQGIFVPNIAFLNGLRNTENGFEFAFGPVFGLRLDTFDDFYISTNFAYAIGKTFKSGNLNIPVNVYVSPDRKQGWFIGSSFGFNVAKHRF